MKVLRRQLALARASASNARRSARRAPASCSRRCAPTTSPARSGSRATARPIRPTCCMSLAKGARQRGVRIVEGVEVVGVSAATTGPRRHATGVRVRHEGEEQDIACEIVVNCAGQWARQLGALAGVNVPLWSAEHFYIVTDRIAGVHPMLPVMRDPDGFIYYKEEVGGLVMGGFEPKAKPWTVDPIPADLPLRAARRGLGPVRAAHDRGDAPHALPRDGAGQDAAQRARELHARRQLHPRRGARAARATSSPPASTPPASPTPAAPAG